MNTFAYEKEGGAAFPCQYPAGDGGTVHEVGMSLRDWFAGQAIIGIRSSSITMGALAKAPGDDDCRLLRAIAILAYAQADAMLAARKQQ